MMMVIIPKAGHACCHDQFLFSKHVAPRHHHHHHHYPLSIFCCRNLTAKLDWLYCLEAPILRKTLLCDS